MLVTPHTTKHHQLAGAKHKTVTRQNNLHRQKTAPAKLVAIGKPPVCAKSPTPAKLPVCTRLQGPACSPVPASLRISTKQYAPATWQALTNRQMTGSHQLNDFLPPTSSHPKIEAPAKGKQAQHYRLQPSTRLPSRRKVHLTRAYHKGAVGDRLKSPAKS